jgi:hypothetical protein
MNVKSRHHLRADAIADIEDAVSEQLGVEIDADNYEKVEFEDSDWDIVLVDGEPLVLSVEGEARSASEQSGDAAEGEAGSASERSSAERSSADDSSGPRGGEAASNGTSAEQSSASSRTGEARETTAEPSPSPRGHDGEFRIELPEDPTDRLSGVLTADDEKVETILDRYVEEIEAELRSVFGLDG